MLIATEATLRKICQNTSFLCPAFFRLRVEPKMLSWHGKKASKKTRILGYFRLWKLRHGETQEKFGHYSLSLSIVLTCFSLSMWLISTLLTLGRTFKRNKRYMFHVWQWSFTLQGQVDCHTEKFSLRKYS